MKQMLSKTCYVLGGGAIIAALIAGFLPSVDAWASIATEPTDMSRKALRGTSTDLRDEYSLWSIPRRLSATDRLLYR